MVATGQVRLPPGGNLMGERSGCEGHSPPQSPTVCVLRERLNSPARSISRPICLTNASGRCASDNPSGLTEKRYYAEKWVLKRGARREARPRVQLWQKTFDQGSLGLIHRVLYRVEVVRVDETKDQICIALCA